MGKLSYVSITISPVYIDKIKEVCKQIKSTLASHGIIFNDMDEHDMHMTIAFIGNKIKNQKKDNITKLKNTISMYDKLVGGDIEICFDSYDLFPKEKQNLVVAKYIIDTKLANILISMRKEIDNINFLSDNKEETFVAHITLGKIISKSKYCYEWHNLLNELPILSGFKPLGCHLVT